MTRGIKGQPGHCKKIMRYNWSHLKTPKSKISILRDEKDRKREIREAKRRRELARNGAHATHYKPQ